MTDLSTTQPGHTPSHRPSAKNDSGWPAFAFAGVIALILAGLAVAGSALFMPVTLRTIDSAVLREAGRGTPALQAAVDEWHAAGKPGTAALLEEAKNRLEQEEGEAPIILIRPPETDPFLRIWGGADPFLLQIFQDGLPEADGANPAVLPLFLRRETRAEIGNFFAGSRHPGVQAILATREVPSAANFMPVDSSAGQPLEATIYLTALLVQGNHLSRELTAEVRQLADTAVRTGELGELEEVYLALLTLGSRLSWQPLADLAIAIEDRATLRRTAHLVRALKEDWPVFAAAAIWTRAPGPLSEYLVREGRKGLQALQLAMRSGDGAVRLLLDRGEPVSAPGWRDRFPGGAPVLLAGLAARFPMEITVLKMIAILGGLCLVFLAINLGTQVTARDPLPRRPFALTFFHSLLVSVATGIFFLFFSEPSLLAADQLSEFRLRISIPIASSGVTEAVPEQTSKMTMEIDRFTIISLVTFFSLQFILYIICRIKVMEIRRQPIASHLKLRLLENEEHLFDCGLYIGLSGTISGLILIALGIIGPSLMAAYSSTLFGIIFVALFKICHLRPYRRRLIVESQTLA